MTKLLGENNKVNLYTVSEADENMRLDNLLIKLLKTVPKTHIYRIIRSGEVRVNKKRSICSLKVNLGDIVRIPPLSIDAAVDKPLPKKIKADFPVIFEDDYYLIIDKPPGTACHGGSGISFGVIEQLRLARANSKFLELAHRLDKDTSGILILAKKRQALVEIQRLLQAGKLAKHYLALTVGVWDCVHRQVKLPLSKYLTKEGERRVKVDHSKGQSALTEFTVISAYKGYTLVDAWLKTGRTHQIHVHLKHIGHPIVGDAKYGNEEDYYGLAHKPKRMFLHALSVEFIHPFSQELIKIEAKLPQSLQLMLDHLQKDAN